MLELDHGTRGADRQAAAVENKSDASNIEMLILCKKDVLGRNVV